METGWGASILFFYWFAALLWAEASRAFKCWSFLEAFMSCFRFLFHRIIPSIISSTLFFWQTCIHFGCIPSGCWCPSTKPFLVKPLTDVNRGENVVRWFLGLRAWQASQDAHLFYGCWATVHLTIDKISAFSNPLAIFFLEYQPFKYLLHFCNMLRCLVVENKNYAYSFLAEQQQFYRKKGKKLCNLIIFLLSSCLSFLLNICSNSQKSSLKKKNIVHDTEVWELCKKISHVTSQW